MTGSPTSLESFATESDALIRTALARPGEKVVIVDDDPTGTQTFRNIPVYFQWSVDDLTAALSRDDAAGFFLTTNSRGQREPEAVRINREIGANLRAAEQRTGRRCHLFSRSDSTLRGHFPAELEALMSGYGAAFDGVLIAPFFHEGGRVTRDDTHYIRKPDGDAPVATTEFARDPVFGYATSHLPGWLEEKSRGRIKASDVQRVALECIRYHGPIGVAAALERVPGGAYCVINAETPDDMNIAMAGAVLAETRGRRFIWRSAASAAQARLGQTGIPLLLEDTELWSNPASAKGGLVIVGSHVPTTTRQLQRLLQGRSDAVGIEADVGRLVGPERERYVAALARLVTITLAADRIAVVYTNRTLASRESPEAFLYFGERITEGLASLAHAVRQPPGFLIAKGGITSHCIARNGLDLRTAWVRGALLPGVPVWRCPADSRWPGLDYVVFPGNVGADDALLRAVQRLTRS